MVGSNGQLNVNGVHVTNLDLHRQLVKGDVAVACCFVVGDSHTGLAQEFDGFTVRPIPPISPTSTTTPTATATKSPRIPQYPRQRPILHPLQLSPLRRQ